MKIFGSHKKSKFIDHSKDKKPLSRGAKAAIIAGSILLALAVGIFAVVKTTVKPPEQHMQAEASAEPVVQEEPVEAEIEILEPEKEPEKKKPEKPKEEPEEEPQTELPLCQVEGVYNILVCGTDGDGTRTDTILIAHMDVNEHKTALMSIPRDTVVAGGNGGIRKINSVYGHGKDEGMKRLQTTLKGILGFQTDGYVLVDLTAFQKIVDLVGGVQFNVPMDMNYDDPTQDLHIHLKQGDQLLNGVDAMGLCRFRKGYASQDIQRTKVQQDFLKALAKQVISLKSLTKIEDMIEIAAEYVITDLKIGNMVYFAKELMKCDLEDIPSYTVEGQGMMINGGSYYPLYSSSILDIVNKSFNPYDTKITSVNVITPDIAKTYQKVTPKPEPQPEEPEEPVDPELPEEPEPEEEPTEDPDLTDDFWDELTEETT